MPKHSYVCDCGKTHERNYGFSDTKPNKIKCECGKNAKRQISVPRFHFKGDGFTKQSA